MVVIRLLFVDFSVIPLEYQ